MADIREELKNSSSEELQLIFDTQKDLYSPEELEIIKSMIEPRKREEQEAVAQKIKSLLPKEIKCEKCDAMNPFENDVCAFCNSKLSKDKYYDLSYYENSEDDEEETEQESHTFLYIISFIIPLVGYIAGAIYLTKDSDSERTTGKDCIIIGIVSTVLAVIISFIYYRSLF